MTKDELLEVFSRIIETHGVITSGYYDKLQVTRPSRWSLYQHFGNWDNAIKAAIKHLEHKGVEITTGESVESDEKVIKLTKQVEELTRHLQLPKLCLEGKSHKFGYVTDTHLGSLYADMALLNFSYDVFASEGVSTVFHSGDIVDGIKMYRGHEYELSAFGADGQVDNVVNEYPRRKGITTYFITGNHDRSFWKMSGIEIGSKISAKRPDMVHLGYQEADIVVGEDDCKATVRLFHPEDGSMSYAISYKAQRYIAELPSGTKPDILCIGHYHKAEMLFYRGVTAFQGGTLQRQTPFMKGKRISAAIGFWLFEVVVGPERVVSVTAKFYPIRS